jgi:hypothetical protein
LASALRPTLFVAVPVPALEKLRFRLLFRFRVQTTFSTVFKKIAQNLAFSVFKISEAAYFPESWHLIFDFFDFFILFYVGSGSKSGSGTVMHSGSGFTTLSLVLTAQGQNTPVGCSLIANPLNTRLEHST